MRNILLPLLCFISLSLMASEYLYNYNDDNNLQTGHYGVVGEANIQYKVLSYLIPLDEELVSLKLLNPQYKSHVQNIKIFNGYARITDGQFIETNHSPSQQFPVKSTISYQTYYKQGVQVLVVKIPHEVYHFAEKSLDILQVATLQILTKQREKGEIKSSFLTNLADFSKITKELVVEERVRDSYYSYYANPYYSGRNSLGIDPAEMIIISPTGLISDWQAYAAYKVGLGLTTQVVDMTSILSTYSGRDNAEKLRNFIIEVYTEWSANKTPLKYVLLGGDYGFVASRQLRITGDSVYSDLYFAGLDGSWDNDNDNIFGEGDASQDAQATGMSGEEADLYAEVAVGRIPVESTMEIENWINKQQDYVSADVSESFYEKVLLVGEYLGNSIYGAPAMNELANNLSEYSLQTLYSQNNTFSLTNLTSAINNGVSQVHHLGHGSITEVFSVDNSGLTTNFVNQDYPFIYTQSCNSARFSHNDSIGENFIIQQRGAFAYIGNTSYGYYSTFENQGPSQLLHREFVDACSHEGIREIGLAFNDSKEDLIGITGQTGSRRYVYFDNILFADPSTELIKDQESVMVEKISDNSIKLSFSGLMPSEVLNINNYTVYQRDEVSISYPVTSISSQASDYFLHFSPDLPAGIPLRISINNIPNILNPTIKLVKSLYTIKESSIITPTIWRAEESPIYVYKHQIINSDLSIEAGTEIRINSNKSFYLYRGGRIQVNGDSLNYVKFTSYSDDPNETDDWTDITFMMEPASDSYFNYTILQNSKNGLWLDSLSTISLNHVRFKDIQNYGIYAQYSTVNANYLEFTGMTNSEKSALKIIGGEQILNHLTSAGNAGYEFIITDSAQTHITNSIIWGQSYLDSEYLTIDYSILPEVYEGSANLTTNPQFVSATDLRLQSTSPAINSGITTVLDADSTITDRGYWSYYYPNNFSAELVFDSSPKLIQFNNLSLGEYDSVEWDFDNDGNWDSSDFSPQFLYLEEGLWDVKMRLTKDEYQAEIIISDLISQTFTSLHVNFPVNISLASTQLELSWEPVDDSDLYNVTSGADLSSEFISLIIQENTIYHTNVFDNRVKFFQIIALEQNIVISD